MEVAIGPGLCPRDGVARSEQIPAVLRRTRAWSLAKIRARNCHLHLVTAPNGRETACQEAGRRRRELAERPRRSATVPSSARCSHLVGVGLRQVGRVQVRCRERPVPQGRPRSDL